MPRIIGQLASAAALIAALSSGALAQNEPSKGSPAAPLSGPGVKERAVPGTAGRFGEREGGKFAQREIPHRAFMEALRQAVGPEAPADIRASAQQQEQIRTLDREFAESMRAFIKANPAAGDLLRRDLRGRPERDGKKNPQAPDAVTAQDEPSEAEMQALRERAEEMRSKAPQAGDVRTKIWAILNEQQQSAVQARLDTLKEEMRARENEQYIKKRVAQKTGQPAPKDNAAPAGATASSVPDAPSKAKGKAKKGAPPAETTPGAQLEPAFRERLLKFFEQLAPERREEVLRRIEERFQNLRKGEPKGGKGAALPPPRPSMDDVNVPAPEPR